MTASIGKGKVLQKIVLKIFVQKHWFSDVLQNGCSKNFAIFTGKTLVLEPLFNKILKKLSKETSKQAFSCYYCEF